MRLLPIIITACTSLLFAACQQNIDTPTLSCTELEMTTTVGNTRSMMNLVTNTVFRQQTDSGGVKYLSLEAVSDSIKVIINVIDGTYPESQLADDSLHLKSYYFSKKANIQGGLVVAASRSIGGFNYFITDTSSVTITRINPKRKTVSGYFYFAAGNNQVTGSGTFQNACYVSLP